MGGTREGERRKMHYIGASVKGFKVDMCGVRGKEHKTAGESK